jgi:hypothetical protein
MRLWAGISAVSAAIQRKAWTLVKAQLLYPNVYILLIGRPGVGKGNAMKELGSWLRDMENIKMAPDGLTQRAFYTTLEHALIQDTDFEGGASAVDVLDRGHHSLTAFIEELGVFLPPGDNKFTYALCHVYDTPERFDYKTEHAGENHMSNVCFTMLSACTPKALKDIFTDQALETGISARTILIFSDDIIDVPIFELPPNRDNLKKDLLYDLHAISRIHGQYQFSEEAATELIAWSKSGFPPIPKDPRFEHYVTRRFVQIVKLCMICAASKRQDPVILPEDLFQAKTFLLDAERVMSGAVTAVGANPYLIQQQQAMRMINLNYQRQMKGTTEAEVRQRLSADLDPRYADMIISDLAKAKWVSATGEAPNRMFYPRGKETKIVVAKDGRAVEKLASPEDPDPPATK